jgi:hypothetical protein
VPIRPWIRDSRRGARAEGQAANWAMPGACRVRTAQRRPAHGAPVHDLAAVVRERTGPGLAGGNDPASRHAVRSLRHWWLTMPMSSATPTTVRDPKHWCGGCGAGQRGIACRGRDVTPRASEAPTSWAFDAPGPMGWSVRSAELMRSPGPSAVDEDPVRQGRNLTLGTQMGPHVPASRHANDCAGRHSFLPPHA